MRLKYNKQVEALLQAAEARARGEKVPLVPGKDPEIPACLKPKRSVGGKAVIPDNHQYRILGIDTALRKTGWGVIDCAGQKVAAVDCGAIINKPTDALSSCLSRLHGAVKELITRYKPDVVSIEGGFYCKNVRTAIVLGTARGAVLGYIADAGIPIYEYAPRRAKQAVCGFGNASKEQVSLMIAQLLKIRVDQLSDDSTDALALAYCHAQSRMQAGLTGEDSAL